MKIALLAKMRNGLLIQFRRERNLSQAQAAKLAGVTHGIWLEIECLKFERVSERAVELVADLLDVRPDEIVPEQLRRKNLISSVERVADVPIERLLENGTARMPLMLECRDPVDEACVNEMRESIGNAMEELPFRQREILNLRFGLDGKPPLTLEECAKVFKVTRERVHSLQVKAIRTLQTPKFVDPLFRVLVD